MDIEKIIPFIFREISDNVINDYSKYLNLFNWKNEFVGLFPSVASASLFYLDPKTKTEIPVF